MNYGYKLAWRAGVGSCVSLSLAAIEQRTGIVSRLAPTESAALAWLCAVGLSIYALRMARGVRVPRAALKWPTATRRYRTRRIVP